MNRIVKTSLLSLAMVGCVNAHEIVIKNLTFTTGTGADDVKVESVLINGVAKTGYKIMFTPESALPPSSTPPVKNLIMNLILDLDGNVATTTDQYKFDLDVVGRKSALEGFGTCSVCFKTPNPNWRINNGSFFNKSDLTSGKGLLFKLLNVVDTKGLPATSAVISKVAVSTKGTSFDEMFTVNGAALPLTDKITWFDAASSELELIATSCNEECFATGLDLTFNVETNPIQGKLRLIAIH